jgi:hypothetical protein
MQLYLCEQSDWMLQKLKEKPTFYFFHVKWDRCNADNQSYYCFLSWTTWQALASSLFVKSFHAPQSVRPTARPVVNTLERQLCSRCLNHFVSHFSTSPPGMHFSSLMSNNILVPDLQMGSNVTPFVCRSHTWQSKCPPLVCQTASLHQESAPREKSIVLSSSPHPVWL